MSRTARVSTRPLLWNIAFDVMLRLPMPRETITVGFTDDPLIVAKDDTIYEVKDQANTAFCAVLECIRCSGLDLAVEKI